MKTTKTDLSILINKLHSLYWPVANVYPINTRASAILVGKSVVYNDLLSNKSDICNILSVYFRSCHQAYVHISGAVNHPECRLWIRITILYSSAAPIPPWQPAGVHVRTYVRTRARCHVHTPVPG